jgi:large subunit ribosomal protein L18
MATIDKRRQRRTGRVRRIVKMRAGDRPRLSVFRSDRHMYAQVIDDGSGRTLAAASTLDADLKGKLKKSATAEAAAEVGKLLAARAVKAGVSQVVFDRGPYLFHGRVKALADAAREGGLSF